MSASIGVLALTDDELAAFDAAYDHAAGIGQNAELELCEEIPRLRATIAARDEEILKLKARVAGKSMTMASVAADRERAETRAGEWMAQVERLVLKIREKEEEIARANSALVAVTELVTGEHNRALVRVKQLEAALWQRVVSISGDPALTFYQCRVCGGVDPERNPQLFTNVGHKADCPGR